MKKRLITTALLAAGIVVTVLADFGSNGWTCYSWTLGPRMSYITCSHKNGNAFTVEVE